MAFKPNYGQERAERNRSKAAKAHKKLQEREEKAALRKEVRREEDLEPGDTTNG